MASGHGGRWTNCVNRGSAGTLTEKHIVWWGSMFNMFKTCWFGEVVLVSMFGTWGARRAVVMRGTPCGKYIVLPVGSRSC